MPATLALRDETTSGRTLHEWSLEFLTERITVRELIRSRVYQEVQDYNLRSDDAYLGLVTPADAEIALNGSKKLKRRDIDWKAQVERAQQAFVANQLLILVNDKQAETLDDEIVVKADTQVTFVKLVPLVGG